MSVDWNYPRVEDNPKNMPIDIIAFRQKFCFLVLRKTVEMRFQGQAGCLKASWADFCSYSWRRRSSKKNGKCRIIHDIPVSSGQSKYLGVVHVCGVYLGMVSVNWKYGSDFGLCWWILLTFSRSARHCSIEDPIWLIVSARSKADRDAELAEYRFL